MQNLKKRKINLSKYQIILIYFNILQNKLRALKWRKL